MRTRTALLTALLACATPTRGADEPKPTGLNQIRLYVPIPQLEERFGKDVEPLTNYMKALQKRAEEIQRAGQDVSPIAKMMQRLRPAVQAGKIDEAGKIADEALKLVGEKEK
jgi:hypothetical protein